MNLYEKMRINRLYRLNKLNRNMRIINNLQND